MQAGFCPLATACCDGADSAASLDPSDGHLFRKATVIADSSRALAKPTALVLEAGTGLRQGDSSEGNP